MTGIGGQWMELPLRWIIVIQPDDPRRRGRYRQVQAIQAERDASPRCLEHRFLARPQLQKRGLLFRRLQRRERCDFFRMKKPLRELHGMRARSKALEVDTGSNTACHGDQCRIAAVRPIELQCPMQRVRQFGTPMFAVDQRDYFRRHAEIHTQQCAQRPTPLRSFIAKLPYVDLVVAQSGSDAGDVLALRSTHTRMLPERSRRSQAETC